MITTGHLPLTEVQHHDPGSQEDGTAAKDEDGESIEGAILGVPQISHRRDQRPSRNRHRPTYFPAVGEIVVVFRPLTVNAGGRALDATADVEGRAAWPQPFREILTGAVP